MFFTTTLQIVLVLSGAIYFITGIYILTVTLPPFFLGGGGGNKANYKTEEFRGRKGKREATRREKRRKRLIGVKKREKILLLFPV